MKNIITVILLTLFLFACGNNESDSPEITSASTSVNPASTSTDNSDLLSLGEKETSADTSMEEEVAVVPTEVPVAATVQTEEPVVATADKPYQIVDGKISSNAIEGWKTYNGGGCGVCHGKGGIGGVAPNLAESITTKLNVDDFRNIVINGKPGTLMRPNNANKRVMDNLDNLYAYLVARGDGVLGNENLIKYSFGKK